MLGFFQQTVRLSFLALQRHQTSPGSQNVFLRTREEREGGRDSGLGGHQHAAAPECRGVRSIEQAALAERSDICKA